MDNGQNASAGTPQPYLTTNVEAARLLEDGYPRSPTAPHEADFGLVF